MHSLRHTLATRLLEDGWVGTHDRTDYWADQADPSVLGQARSLGLINFYDPKNMLLTDISILGNTAQEIAKTIEAIAAAA